MERTILSSKQRFYSGAPYSKRNNNKRRSSKKRKSPENTIYRTKLLVFGYIRRKIISKSNNDLYIPSVIIDIILPYYPQYKYQVYGKGWNVYGELGLGNDDPVYRSMNLKSISSRMDSQHCIRRREHGFVIQDTSSQIYTVGKNEFGECSLGVAYSKVDCVKTVERIQFFNTNNGFLNDFIKIISDGLCSHHVFFVTNSNQIYSCGCNDASQLGNGEISEEDKYPVPIYANIINDVFHSNNITISKIATGYNHSLFLTETGTVWSSGFTKNGECGIARMHENDDNYQMVPMLVTFIKNTKIIDVVCGESHNLCLSNNKKEIWVFGNNAVGQCGVGNSQISQILTPITINTQGILPNNEHIANIVAGASHSGFVRSDGIAYLFGDNQYLQIGISPEFIISNTVYEPTAFSPSKNENLNNIVKQMSLGNYHSVLLTDDNDVIAFGNNEYRQCSGDTTVNVHPQSLLDQFKKSDNSLYVKMETLNIVSVLAGSSCTLLIFEKKY